MNSILSNRWSNIDKLLTSFKNKYIKNNDLKQDIQNLMDSLNVSYDDLNKPITKKERLLLETTIKQIENDNLFKGYFKYRINELMSGSINYRDYIEIMLYVSYMKNLSHNIDDIFSLITDSGYITFNQGRKDLNKETLKKKPTYWLNLVPNLLVGGVMLDEYLNAVYLTNMQECMKLILIDLQLKNKLDVTNKKYNELFTKQNNRIININNGKSSGGLDKYVVAFANQQYIEASGNENQKVRFIAEIDNKTTDMCESLNNQIFNTKDINKFYRYSAIDGRKVEYVVKGLEIGANLPPIDNHFHYCRSTIVYLENKKIPKTKNSDYYRRKLDEKEQLKLLKKLNNILDKYIDIPSKWSGKINLKSDIDYHAKEWDCSITTNSTTNEQLLNHELLHARSISHYGEEEYNLATYEEESVIEFLNKQIMLKENYDYGESVYNYLVEKLEDISNNLNKDKLTFGLELIKIKPSKRREYIMSLTNSKNKDIIDEYIQEAFVLWNKQ